MVVGIPDNHGEQHGRDKQHDVAPVASVGEVPGLALKLPTLLLSQEEVVDVLPDHLLERGATRGAPCSSGITCTSSISDLMTARKSGTFGWDLPAMPPSRTPPANGAAP